MKAASTALVEAGYGSKESLGKSGIGGGILAGQSGELIGRQWTKVGGDTTNAAGARPLDDDSEMMEAGGIETVITSFLSPHGRPLPKTVLRPARR
jgi:hypothetical protein